MAGPEGLEMAQDLGVAVAVGGVAGPGLDAEAVGGDPLADPGEDVGFLGFFDAGALLYLALFCLQSFEALGRAGRRWLALLAFYVVWPGGFSSASS
jgi:hypothetical protein